MKIGILTYYGDLNFGTNLQAYSTYLMVKSLHENDEVEIIPFHGFYNFNKPFKSTSIKSVLRDCERIRKYAEFRKKYLNIKKDRTIRDVKKAISYVNDRGYDRIYVGADTVLELDRLRKGEDGLSAYWLLNVKAEKIILAASVKNLDYDSLSEKQLEEMRVAVSQFSHIAVRDHASYSLFRHFLSEDKLCYIPDPTFSFDIDYQYVDAYLKKRNLSIPEKSVFVHTCGDDNWMMHITDQLHSLGYVVYSPRPVAWCDVSLNDMGPLEQMGIYGKFSFVITHRFHDGVFCLKNAVPFFMYVKSRGNLVSSLGDSKQVSLLRDFDLYPNSFIGYVDDGISVLNMKERIDSLLDFYRNYDLKERLNRCKSVYSDYLKSTI